MNCPNCGTEIPTGSWQRANSLHSTALALPGQTAGSAGGIDIGSAYRKTPYRKMELVPDVAVPLLQALITGVIIAVVFSLVIPYIKGLAWYSGIYVGIVATGLAWGFMLGSSKETLWIIEEITGKDLDKDGHTGRPQSQTLHIEIKDSDQRRTIIEDLPGPAADLVKFAQDVTAGDSFSERTAQACGYGVTNFRTLRLIFVNRRWAYWKNPDSPQQGVELTLSGKQIMADIARSPAPPAQVSQFDTR